MAWPERTRGGGSPVLPWSPSQLALWCALIACVALGSGTVALAQSDATSDLAIELRWQSDPASGCPDAQQVRHDVEERLRRRVFGRDDGSPTQPFVVSGRMQQVDGQWRVDIELSDPEARSLGQRSLLGSSPECGALRRSVAIIVSLLVDQRADEITLYEPPEPPSATAPEPDPTSEGAAVPSAAQDTDQESPQARLGLALGGRVSGLGLPGPAWAVEQVIRAGLPGLPLSFAAELSIAPEFGIERESASAQVWLWSLGAFACPEFFEKPELRIVTCVGASAGQLHARGTGFDVGRSAAGAHVEVGLRAGLEVRLVGPLFLRVVGSLDVPVLARDLVYGAPEAERALHTSGPVSLGASLALGLLLPPDPL